MQSYSVDEEALMAMLSIRTNSERRAIDREYKNNSNSHRLLSKDLSIEFGAVSEDFLVTLMGKPNCYLCKELHAAAISSDKGQLDLIEIIFPRTASELEEICWTYETLYDTALTDDLHAEREDHFRALLIKILQLPPLHHKNDTNPAEAEEQAQQLIQRGLVKPDPSLLFSLILRFKRDHLRLVFDHFESSSNFTINFFLDNELKRDPIIAAGIKDIVQLIRAPAQYFIKRLREALEKEDQATVLRIIMSRCEIDLKTICEEYQEMFGVSLYDDVMEKSSATYKKSLGYFIMGNIPTEEKVAVKA